MNKLILSALLLSATILSVTAADKWYENKGLEYYFSRTPLTYSAAVLSCKKHEAQLVKVDSSVTQAFISKTIVSSGLSIDYYIGDTRLASGGYSYGNNVVDTYTNWVTGASKTAKCVQLLHNVQKWKDISCDTKSNYICQRVIPTKGALKYCSAHGDPHFTAFDGRYFNFQGECTYVLVKSIENNGFNSFSIEAKTEQWTNHRGVSVVRTVIIKSHGMEVKLLRGFKVEVNCQAVDLPYTRKGLCIYKTGGLVVVDLHNGVKIKFNGLYDLDIGAPPSLKNKVEGICGNYNGNEADDFVIKATGKILTNSPADYTLYGNQFISADEPGCKANIALSQCAGDKLKVYESKCEIMVKNKCFARCREVVDASAFVKNCAYDNCASKDAKAALATNVGAFVEECQNKKLNVCDNWRLVVGLEMHCKANFHYTSCGTACPKTCAKLTIPSCTTQCIDGCVCNNGFLLSGQSCVKQPNCGCTEKGEYYKSGDSVYKNACSSVCKCLAGVYGCKATQCGGTQQTCDQNADGVEKCNGPPDVWIPCGGNEYLISTATATNAEAVIQCKKVGATLAILKACKVQAVIYEAIKGVKDYGQAYSHGYYFGLHRVAGSSDNYAFVWLDGSRSISAEWRWCKGEPNNQGFENCVEMYKSNQWNDVPCSSERRYICERKHK